VAGPCGHGPSCSAKGGEFLERVLAAEEGLTPCSYVGRIAVGIMVELGDLQSIIRITRTVPRCIQIT
jgi:hypothetical protein